MCTYLGYIWFLSHLSYSLVNKVLVDVIMNTIIYDIMEINSDHTTNDGEHLQTNIHEIGIYEKVDSLCFVSDLLAIE